MAMDELEVSKIFGAGCAALLAFVGFGQLGSAVVGVDKLDEPAYVIEIPETEGGGGDVEVAEAMPIGQVMAMADMDLGAKVFKKCSSCHKIADGEAHGIGPDLYGIVGRDIAGSDGYAYSDALMEKDGPWDFAALDGFLEAPKKWAKGTKMGFAGLSKPEDRGSVIAWLNEQSDSPLQMPAVEAKVEEAEEPEVAAAETEAPAEADKAEAEAPAEAEKAEAEAPAEAEKAEAEAPAEAEKAEAEAPAEAEKAEAEAPAEAEKAEAEAPAEAEKAEAEAPAEAEKAEAEKAEAPEETKIAEAAAATVGAGAAAFMIGADMDKGAKVFRKCKACHKVEADAGNGVGPNLHGVVGRDIAALDGFKYSKALSGKDGVWDFETLNAFLLKPKDWAKGTKMAFAGLRKEEDRAAIIAWLNAQSDAPLPLPE